MTKERATDAYYAEAASWDADRVVMQRRSARIAWWVAGAGWVCAMTAGVALMLLMPLKRVEPFVIRVDNTTGLVDVVPVYVGHAPMPEVVTRYFLEHYVTICERFNFATAESDYEECGAFNTAKGNELLFATWNKTNPESPLNLYKDGTTIRAEVTSVSFFTRADGMTDLAQVRYFKGTRQAGSGEEQRTYWIATVRYAYSAPSADPQVRRFNPLGFKIVDFRAEPEIGGEGAPTATSIGTPAHGSSSGAGP